MFYHRYPNLYYLVEIIEKTRFVYEAWGKSLQTSLSGVFCLSESLKPSVSTD
jgi:hypothetical protein